MFVFSKGLSKLTFPFENLSLVNNPCPIKQSLPIVTLEQMMALYSSVGANSDLACISTKGPMKTSYQIRVWVYWFNN